MVNYEHTPVSVEGKRAVVIGGTSGIGRAIAMGFAADGAEAVVATSRTPERVEEAAEGVRERGAESLELTCDVSDRESLAELADGTLEEFGGVDVLVNSPSSIARKSVTDVSEEEWRDVLDVQLDGVYRAIQVFAERMDGGSVVNIASLASVLALPELSAYSAAKGGVDALTRAAAKDLAPEVRVNAIRPGFFITEQTEEAYAEGTERYREVTGRSMLPRFGDPAELAGAAIYLASDAASYTTGEVLTVDGGFRTSTF
ncbi:SDR family NAD(P)-dependent oxidoreductase [Salinirubellus sp. GCM10025818]|jgi:NAD(P)-dependent dehydrogenase (short-subunit alcohol dehydrogenase family)|uniref:SDR family NAD(P)-dependent oxidoreductase n=1 Tax=Salinirubellus TaxID=2162630 RepID=UPI0030CE6407